MLTFQSLRAISLQGLKTSEVQALCKKSWEALCVCKIQGLQMDNFWEVVGGSEILAYSSCAELNEIRIRVFRQGPIRYEFANICFRYLKNFLGRLGCIPVY